MPLSRSRKLKAGLLWSESIVSSDRGAPVTVATSAEQQALNGITGLDQQLRAQFESRLIVEPALTRPLVSFQASKARSGYRWYKFKEAFSAPLIEYLLRTYASSAQRLLDPFAGSGTALFVGSAHGLRTSGIELLPIGHTLINARRQFEAGLPQQILGTLQRWAENKVWNQTEALSPLPELRITQGAYPAETRAKIECYLAALRAESQPAQAILFFVLLCVLEDVSYTRKDGQYLRWDQRAGRASGGKLFSKGRISDFDQAISAKLAEILHDLQEQQSPTDLFPDSSLRGEIALHAGSCLETLPTLPSDFYDVVITSPPYCNRYDYTRTYALELALLGVGEKELLGLRQQMLSCTVENRAKDLLRLNPAWETALTAADQQPLLQAILSYLEQQRIAGKLNNTGIARMVKGYFYEMACVIAECARVLRPGAPLLMVNDNVRYAGASISVDLILSALAEKLGFTVERILVLPGGKGNSSQQMGAHGREALRKCVYIWRRR